ncbi:MAG: hypothetical protein ACRD4S_14660 [Candidatus Acidiferrales bacterium]
MLFLSSIAAGSLWSEFDSGIWSSMLLDVTLPPIASAFIAKGKVGRYNRAIARNGMVLLLSSCELPKLERSRIRMRISIWHRVVLPGDRPAPHGLLFVADAFKGGGMQGGNAQDSALQSLAGSLSGSHDTSALLSIDLGGGRFLNFV